MAKQSSSKINILRAAKSGKATATTVVTPGGESIVIVSHAEYERLTGMAGQGAVTAEDAADIRAYDQVKAALATGDEEFLTAAEVEALAVAATPMLFWRKKRHMTQSDLAKAIGTAQSHISEIETGGSGMSFETAQKIAAALDVTLDNLAD